MNAGQLGGLLYANPLAVLAMLAILAVILAHRLQDSSPKLAKGLGNAGYIGMIGALMLIMVQSTQQAKNSDVALMTSKRPAISVRGSETVVPMADDGHYWVEAEVNGKSGWFLIDTGASFTSLAPDFAAEAGVLPDPHKMPVDLNTANGMITARVGKIAKLGFGNVEVANLEATISPVTNEDTNLIGMNLLSRLGTWRVEGDTLVLVPRN